METSKEDIVATVIQHLIDITGGRCSITQEQIREYEEEPAMAHILSGLLYLHDDLVYQEDKLNRMMEDLKSALYRLENKNKELEQSKATLETLAAELSTPIIQVGRRVLMMPLVGALDHARTSAIMQRLLPAVVEQRARYIILDITGVSMIDTSTVSHFLQIVGAVSLLGSKSIIAGVQARVASAIVALGIDLTGVVTVRNTREAIRYCVTV